jgi:hypothetical protein
VDAEAQALYERCFPHVPTALLAHLYRAGEAFPPNTAPRAEGSFQHVLDAGEWTGQLTEGGQFIRFDCPACSSLMFQPNTDRGIAHALKVARAHKPDCCAERAARFAETGTAAVWPDSLDE